MLGSNSYRGPLRKWAEDEHLLHCSRLHWVIKKILPRLCELEVAELVPNCHQLYEAGLRHDHLSFDKGADQRRLQVGVEEGDVVADQVACAIHLKKKEEKKEEVIIYVVLL